MAKKVKELQYDICGNVFNNYGCMKMDGTPVERTKYTHPYSYDDFVMWHDEKFEFGNKPYWDGCAYSDRILTWDWDKHNKFCRKHFKNEGQYWNNREPKLIEKFLQDYFDYPNLKLNVIIEGCNHSNGYPYWAFLFTKGAI